jgi:hypothetical protein
MSLQELDNLVRTGLLKAEPGNQKEFDELVAWGRKRQADAAVKGLSLEGQFISAYDAAHAFSLAAMRWHGYRPAKRYAVFQALPHTLGLPPSIWRVLDKCHSARNAAEYEGRFDVDQQLFAELLTATEALRSAVLKLGPVSASKRKDK